MSRPAAAYSSPHVQSDEQLATLAAQGEQQAFSTLVARHSPALLAYARNTAGVQQADDVLQQSLMQAWSALRRGAEIQHVRGWLFQIVRHASWAASQARTCTELPQTLAGPDDLHAKTEQRMQLRRVVEHVGKLPEQQRIALVQTAVEGRSRADVAATLGVSEGAVGQLLYRGRERVRQAAGCLIPMPLWNWINRGAATGDVGASAGESTAALGFLGAAGKAIAVALSVSVAAAATGAEIRHLRHNAARSGAAVDVTDAGLSPAARQLAALLALPRGASGGTVSGVGVVGGAFAGGGGFAALSPSGPSTGPLSPAYAAGADTPADPIPSAAGDAVGGGVADPNGSASGPSGATAAAGTGSAAAGAGDPGAVNEDHPPGAGADPASDDPASSPATAEDTAPAASGDAAAAPSGDSSAATSPAADSTPATTDPPATDPTTEPTTPDPSSTSQPSAVGFELLPDPDAGS